MVREGVQCFENVRRRYDGERRNPWDEPECGHHYARAMAAWSGIVALSGFRYHGQEKSVIAIPKFGPATSVLLVHGHGMGHVSRRQVGGFTWPCCGQAACRSVELAGERAPAKSTASVGGKAHRARGELSRISARLSPSRKVSKSAKATGLSLAL